MKSRGSLYRTTTFRGARAFGAMYEFHIFWSSFFYPTADGEKNSLTKLTTFARILIHVVSQLVSTLFAI